MSSHTSDAETIALAAPRLGFIGPVPYQLILVAARHKQGPVHTCLVSWASEKFTDAAMP